MIERLVVQILLQFVIVPLSKNSKLLQMGLGKPYMAAVTH